MLRSTQLTRCVTHTKFTRCMSDQKTTTSTDPPTKPSEQNSKPEPPKPADPAKKDLMNTETEYDQVMSKWRQTFGLETPIGVALRKTVTITYSTLAQMIEMIFDKTEMFKYKAQPVVKKSLQVAKLNFLNVSDVIQEKNPRLAKTAGNMKKSVKQAAMNVRTKAVRFDEKYQVQYGFKTRIMKGSISILEGIKTVSHKLQSKLAVIPRPKDDSLKEEISYDLKVLSTGAISRTITATEYLQQSLTQKSAAIKPRQISLPADPVPKKIERKVNDEEELLKEEKIYEEKLRKLQENSKLLVPPKPRPPSLKENLIAIFRKTSTSFKSFFSSKAPDSSILTGKDSIQAASGKSNSTDEKPKEEKLQISKADAPKLIAMTNSTKPPIKIWLTEAQNGENVVAGSIMGTQYVRVTKRFEFDDVILLCEVKPDNVEIKVAEPKIKLDPIKKVAIAISNPRTPPEIQTKPLRINVVKEQSAEQAIAARLKARRNELQQRAESRRAKARKERLRKVTDQIFKNIDFPELKVRRIDLDAVEEQGKPDVELLYRLMKSETKKIPDEKVTLTEEQKKALEALKVIEKTFEEFSEKINLIKRHRHHFQEGVKQMKTELKSNKDEGGKGEDQ